MNALDFEAGTSQRLEGRTLGGYRVLRAIAAGGMATLYLARKTGVMGFAQNAALKVVHPHLAVQPAFASMFLDEARIASCINHPNVCRVLDFGEDDGTFFLAMEYVRGESFNDVLEALGTSPEVAARAAALASWVVAQACEGLHAAHEAVGPEGEPLHIVHRDVSPHNILVGYDGSVRIVDFGIAYAAERSQDTRDGAVKGRYGYMAPEQMRGEPLDRRADVWSLGVVLREAITGKRLFARDTDAATIYAVTEQPLPSWPEQVPTELREIADRALSRAPNERFASAREMGRALGKALMAQGTGSADLSHWMHALFARQIAEKAALVRELAAGTTGEFARQEPAPPLVTTDGLPARGETGSPHISSVRAVARLPGALQRVLVALSRSRAGQLAVGALLLLLVLLLAYRSEPAAPQLTLPRTEQSPPAVVVPVPEVESLAPKNAVDEPAPEQKSERGARSAGRGTVAIGSDSGWAEVHLGKRRLGTTPLRTSLPAGTHILEVRPGGRLPGKRVRIEVRPNELTKLKL